MSIVVVAFALGWRSVEICVQLCTDGLRNDDNDDDDGIEIDDDYENDE